MLSPAVPFVITLYLIYYNYAYSNSNVFEKAPCLFVFAFGFVLAKVSIVLLVSGRFYCTCASIVAATFKYIDNSRTS